MTLRWSVVVLAGAFALAGLSPARAQGVTSIRGRVVDCDAALDPRDVRTAPLEATIRLAENGGSTRTLVTGADGRFAFLTSSDGGGRIDVEATGHVNRVIGFDTRGSDSLSLNVFLVRTYAGMSWMASDRIQALLKACENASLPRPDPDTVDRYTLRS